MSVVVLCLDNDLYLESYDPDFVPPPPFPPYPGGKATFTADINQAMIFESIEAAVACYLAVSKTVPTRPDGQPNRPLSSLSMMLTEFS